MVSVRWLDAEEGVRRSKRRRWESEDTAERTEASWGEKAAEYVQLCVGRVSSEELRVGDHCLLKAMLGGGFFKKRGYW